MVTEPSSLSRLYSGSVGTAGGSGLHVMSGEIYNLIFLLLSVYSDTC